MKVTFNTLFLIIILSITCYFMHIITNPVLCEPEGFQENNLFYKITQTNHFEWRVWFKNVRVGYNIVGVQQSHGHVDYHFLERNTLNTENVYVVRSSSNVTGAVMAHFNDIQRGIYHTDHPNHINPNPHGRSTNDFGRGIRSPLDQFEIRDLISMNAPILGNFHLSYTNIGLYLSISAVIVVILNILATNYNKVVANKWSISQESIYATIHSIVINQIDEKDGQKYYPFIYTLFIIILTSNLVGMIPYSFASTSHFILTFFLSFSIVLGSTILGFFIHKTKFFSLFVPSGCPLGLLPLLVLIEFISFLARNVSLGLRLAANILSGHMLLNILSDFTYKIMETNIIYFFLALIPLMFIIAFSALELGIAFIQSQVFVVLSSSYIKDSLGLH